jgi:hypothetical protein
MVGNGNHPLNRSHHNEETLHQYVLGHLPPDDEEQVRQHLNVCPLCRAAVTDIRSFCQRLSFGLHQELDSARPGSRLSFERVEWHRPPRRDIILFRLQRFAPRALVVLLLILLVGAIRLLRSSDSSAALSRLELPDDYDGPPAVLAVSTGDGLVVLRLSADKPDVVSHRPDVDNPRDLQFSLDGRWLAFQQDQTLVVMAVQGSSASFRFPVHETAEWAWSPDGQTLAYTDGNGQLVVFAPVSAASRVLVPADESAWGLPVWNATSSRISYTVVKPLHATGGPYLRQGTWCVSVATGQRVELTRNPAAYDTLLLAAAPGRADSTLLTRQDDRIALMLHKAMSESAPTDQILWPQSLEWAPNGAWLAYTVTGAAEGEGVYLFAIDKSELRPVKLPGGATEQAVFWVGAEHLFVIRQAQNTTTGELWVVPLSTGKPSQRVITHIRLPSDPPYDGWRWHDVLAVQPLTP